MKKHLISLIDILDKYLCVIQKKENKEQENNSNYEELAYGLFGTNGNLAIQQAKQLENTILCRKYEENQQIKTKAKYLIQLMDKLISNESKNNQ